MLTYLSIQAYHKKDKKIYGVWSVDFVNGYIGIFEGKDINDYKKRHVEVEHLEDFYLIVSFDMLKSVKRKKQQPQMITLQMLNNQVKQDKNKKVKRRR